MLQKKKRFLVPGWNCDKPEKEGDCNPCNDATAASWAAIDSYEVIFGWPNSVSIELPTGVEQKSEFCASVSDALSLESLLSESCKGCRQNNYIN